MNVQETAETAIAIRNGLASDAIACPRELGLASYIPESEVRGIGRTLPETPVVIWTPDMFELASSGYESFTGLHFSSLPMPESPQFWYFDQFYLTPNDVILSEHKVPDSYVSYSMIFWPAGFRGAEVPLMIYVCSPDASLGQRGRIVLRMMRADGIKRDGVTLKHAAQMFAAYAFTQLKIAAQEQVVLPRGTRRRMKRLNQAIPDVRVVQLRQREPSGNAQNGNREYHHKWIVQGHWRRLHEPRKADGAEVTFVHAYVKGPQDAPLLQPRESVYVVAR